MIQVEVAYAKPQTQRIISLTVPEGTCLLEAVQLSGILSEFPEIDLARAKMGVFGRLEKNPQSRILNNGDRVEIYRPLLADPKEIRRRKAQGI